MTPPRPGTDLLTFCSMLVLLATTAVAGLRLAADPTGLDPRLLDLSLIGLGVLAMGLAVDSRRIRLLIPAAPALILVGLLHLALALASLTGGPAASAGIGGVVELLVGLALLPAALAAAVDVPGLRVDLKEQAERHRVASQALQAAAMDLGRADAKADELRQLAADWERYARAQDVRTSRLSERLTELRRSILPEENVLVIPASAHGALRRFLLGLAETLGWTRVRALPEAVRLAVGQGQVVYVDGLEDPTSECLFLQAVAETELMTGDGGGQRPPWAPTREIPARGPTTRVIDELLAIHCDVGAPLRTLRDTADRAATTLPSGEEAVA